MEIKVRPAGNGIGCFGWSRHGRLRLQDSLPERTLLKVVARKPHGGWAPEDSLTVRDREGEQWTIDASQFEERLQYSFDGGVTWLPERIQRVQAYLRREYNQTEALVEKQQLALRSLRWILERNGKDPDERRREIERLEALLKQPCKHHKPGSGRSWWESQQAANRAALRRLQEGADES